ncbi:ECF transporter S component [Murimonas intestini]|uniref:Riboflavin transporter n=1 Tax=Murimonas intestini TaxID=1337051 RepID=A0AB73SXK2_9FIRM|nr:ECF transporter S component [Murimonas intestini]MCR1843437.1 ECF transporter S component [Murimonas intestini]MCR1868770.1 ECF transporter S component [Murimonas intestini]MCR1886375.1 ECF transporter S component [Murimonas intestini]
MSSNTNVNGGAAAMTRAGQQSKVKMMVEIAMLGAIATVLMLFEIPLPFAPAFYQIDLSEVPILIGCFSMGPLAGAAIEFLKILLNFLINGTITAGVGELANFIVGCALVLPAGFIYKYHKTKKNAMIGMAAGTAAMTIVGGFMNAFVLLPLYAAAFGGIDAIIGMGSDVNSAVSGMSGFIMLIVVPFNLLKGIIVSIVTLLLYKYISPILKRAR